MERTEPVLTTTPSRSIIYLTPSHDETMRGCIYNEYYKKVFHFQNEYEMISAMEDLFNSLAFPHASFESRSFQDKFKKIIKKVDDVMDDSMKDLRQNEKTTFIVNVQYRQNATWQGTITWVEENRTQHFRSALEMLKLMEQASHQGNVEVVDWKED